MPLLQSIEAVKSSGLTKAQKDLILREMAAQLPAPVFCKACPETLEIIGSLLGVKSNGRTQEPKKEESQKGTNDAAEGPSGGEGKLLRKTDGNRGRSRPKKAVVNQKA